MSETLVFTIRVIIGMNKLKPCAHCGSKSIWAHIYEAYDDYEERDEHKVDLWCHDCGIGFKEYWADSKQEAEMLMLEMIVKWNRRPDDIEFKR